MTVPNEDLCGWMNKVYGGAAENYYRQNPTLPHCSNPHLPGGAYVPKASNRSASSIKYS